MSMVYLEFTFTVSPLQPGTEILIAELGFAGFESFVETDEGVLAYIQRQDWQVDLLEKIEILRSPEFNISYAKRLIAQQNWNEEWEKNFQPIVVDEKCAVRAPFHAAFDLPYEIVIEPKMSFGTGHHETTFMMLQWLMEIDCTDKNVLDMGCGTAVLAIMAKLKGASSVLAIDIDQWCVENSLENISRNDCDSIEVQLGDASILPNEPIFDLIIANINRNILLRDMQAYLKALKNGGTLLLSGFYQEDLSVIKEVCTDLNMQFVDNKVKNNWVAAKFVNLTHESQ